MTVASENENEVKINADTTINEKERSSTLGSTRQETTISVPIISASSNKSLMQNDVDKQSSLTVVSGNLIPVCATENAHKQALSQQAQVKEQISVSDKECVCEKEKIENRISGEVEIQNTILGDPRKELLEENEKNGKEEIIYSPEIEGEIEGEKIKILFDTGSRLTCISSDLYERNKNKWRKYPTLPLVGVEAIEFTGEKHTN